MKNINETHLKLIQANVARMNQNSSNIKILYFTLLSAFLGFSKMDLIKNKIPIIFILPLVFCIIDSYYLYLERGFRHLYEIAANLKQDEKLKGDFDMSIPLKDRTVKKFLKSFFSLTEVIFYLGVFIASWAILVSC